MLKKSLLFASVFFSGVTLAKTCDVAIEGNDQMQFNTKEIKVDKTCTDVTLTLKHTGKLAKNVMGHNWILAKKSDMQAIATAGMTAGPAKDYHDSADKRIVAATKMVGAGEETKVTFSLKGMDPKGDYAFFCTYPGHLALMSGKFVFGG